MTYEGLFPTSVTQCGIVAITHLYLGSALTKHLSEPFLIHRLRVFENREMKRIRGSKREDI
jgi:hypothetical protein